MDPGTKLGPYEILEPLGAGGMGEVYLAEDTRLHRKVAVKVLPEAFARDPERLARFEQEARAAAALNHPHIAAVHDIGVENNVHYMVQEYLEGRPLSDELAERPPKLQRALRIAAEIAEALGTAHRAGIVHRDIKPDNVFVTAAGHTKVLDFGLAKLLETTPLGGATDQTMSPTAIGTMAGVVMGTVGYMAPEQVEGGLIDGRTDVFALGCLLYELVSGQRPFVGDSLHETLHKIGHADPPTLQEIRHDLPQELQRVLDKCLRKEPDRRYQHVDDLAVDLRQLALDLESGMAGRSTAAEDAPATDAGLSVVRGRPSVLVLVAGVSLAILAGIAIGRWSDRPLAVSRLPLRATVLLPAQLNGSGLSIRPLAISPQGDKLAAVLQRASGTQLYVRYLDRDEAVAVPGTEGATNPFFAPSGDTIAYFAHNSIMRVSIEDGGFGTPFRIARTEGASYGGTWADDDTIYYATNSRLAPLGVPAAGGVAEEITVPAPAPGRYSAPFALPGGRELLVTIRDSSGGGISSSVGVISLTTGEERILVPGTSAQALPSGHLVWVQPASETANSAPLMVAPFDAEKLELSGPAVPLSLNVPISRPDGRPRIAISETGILALGATRQVTEAFLAWVERDGSAELLRGALAAFTNPRLAPDGKRVAYGVSDFSNVQVLDLERGSVTQLPGAGGTQYFPVWIPGEEALYLMSSADGPLNLFRGPADGSTLPERILDSETTLAPMSVGPDGTLFYYEVTNAAERDIWALPPEGDPVRVVSTDADERGPMISPDGRYLAYVSNEAGGDEVYVRPFPAGEARYKISAGGGREPQWRRDGRELFYREGDRMYGVAIAVEGGDFRPGRPELLFERPFVLDQFGNANYDVSLDGKRFLMVTSGASEEVAELQLMVNWFEELNRIAPTTR